MCRSVYICYIWKTMKRVNIQLQISFGHIYQILITSIIDPLHTHRRSLIKKNYFSTIQDMKRVFFIIHWQTLIVASLFLLFGLIEHVCPWFSRSWSGTTDLSFYVRVLHLISLVKRNLLYRKNLVYFSIGISIVKNNSAGCLFYWRLFWSVCVNCFPHK